MISRQDAFLQRIQNGSRELDERFRILCQCQKPRELGCNAVLARVRDSSPNTPLSMFLKGWESNPFCGRGADATMEGGLFKGRRYCWQHYSTHTICDSCHSKGYTNYYAEYIYLWEYYPKRKYNWKDHGRLMIGPEWPTTDPWDKDWGERLIHSGEWLPQEEKTWLCRVCRDALAERLARANLKQRRNLIKQEKALGKGKEIYTWLRKYLKERKREAYL